MDSEKEKKLFFRCVVVAGRFFQFPFLCPNGTVFSEELVTCNWWWMVDCLPSGFFIVHLLADVFSLLHLGLLTLIVRLKHLKMPENSTEMSIVLSVSSYLTIVFI